MTLTGLVKDFSGLVIARVFLGIAESGLFPVSLIPMEPFSHRLTTYFHRVSTTTSPYGIVDASVHSAQQSSSPQPLLPAHSVVYLHVGLMKWLA